MFNGLADSIWVGSKHREEAWQWVRWLASAECQGVVAARGAVFPAIDGLAEQVLQVHRAKGIDASAFLVMAKEQTFASPVSDKGAEITSLMKNAIESVLLGKRQAAPALRDANDKINKLLAAAMAP